MFARYQLAYAVVVPFYVYFVNTVIINVVLFFYVDVRYCARQ